ncbi:MAG TPA: SCO family protein [Vicinamibacterales bacterium]|nr:SCO family protein [Vicinamibacterales bacterium]
MSRRIATLFLLMGAGGLLLAGCGRRAPRYELQGQVLALSASPASGRPEVTVKHKDIRGFMPAMTMAYRVKDARLLSGLAPGDLVTATLVVDGDDAYLSAITKTGTAPLPAAGLVPHVMDLLEPGDRVPDVPLTDQDGHPVRLSDWHGQVVAVTFIYTRCPLPNFCPLMDRNFKAVQAQVERDAVLAGHVHLLSVSFDPAHDTPAVLKTHASALGADTRVWTFATAPVPTIDAFASRFGVSVMRQTDRTQSVTHNLRTAVIDPEGRLVTIHSGNDWTPDTLVTDLRTARATQ